MVHPNSGFYEKDGKEYVSVSSVLGRTSDFFDPGKQKGLDIWRQMEPDWQEIVDNARQRGTLIHSEIELALAGTFVKHKSDQVTMGKIMQYNVHEYMTYLSPVLEKIKQENQSNSADSPLLIEEELFCDYGYAGTPDLRPRWDGQYSVWDWKSVRSYKEKNVKKKAKSISQYKNAFVQIGAYALAHNLAVRAGKLDNEITQGVICVCYDWREPHVHVLDKAELKAAALEFVERYKTYCSLENTTFPRAIQAAN